MGALLPPVSGITLNKAEWDKLKACMAELDSKIE